jgi:hypothetical protein
MYDLCHATPKINFLHLKMPRYNYFFAAWQVFLCGFPCTYVSIYCLSLVVYIVVLLKKMKTCQVAKM